MAIGLTPEHEDLAASVRGWAERNVSDASAEAGDRPDFWNGLAEQGLLGLHLPEEHGGQGAGVLELAVALEEMGRALAPGPFLPTALASTLVARCTNEKAHAALLPGLADGTRTAAVATRSGFTARPRAGGGRTVSGTVEPVLGASVADILLVCLVTPDGEAWAALETGTLEVEALPALDPSRPMCRVRADDLVVPADAMLDGVDTGLVNDTAALLMGAEAAGVAAWCLTAASDYAKVREQFGRPIGQFQGVKHKCARMAIAVEEARAAVWDAARAADEAARDGGSASGAHFAAAVAGLVAPDNALACARDCIQVLGGIGFTWEHDAHRYLRRASTLRAIAGSSNEWATTVGGLALSGESRPVRIELEQESTGGTADAVDTGVGGALRERVRAEVAELAGVEDEKTRFAAMSDGGWVMPHLPRPWGRDAPPLEQVLIHQELRHAGVKGPRLAIGAWVVPSVAGHGTAEQQERFLRPTLRGEIMWCQLFSEPGAGSDLASLTMRAERVEGGYRLTGQKIWTSVAQMAQWGICLARTDPDAPSKHEGLTYFVVDMSTPGIEVRPLRELTGDALFNEVFFDGAFVPDDCVIGEPGHGWKVARNTLSNERVALSGGSSGMGAGVPELLGFFAQMQGEADRELRAEVGRLAAQGQTIELLGLRVTLKQLSGLEPGAESSVRKLLGVEFNQRVADYLWEAQGPAAALEAPGTATGIWARYMLFSRSMTIYGGTTEVQLNIIAERLLGLPRDP